MFGSTLTTRLCGCSDHALYALGEACGALLRTATINVDDCDDNDADVMASIMAQLSAAITHANTMDEIGLPLTPAELATQQAMFDAFATNGFALLSASGQTALAGIMGDLTGLMADIIAGSISTLDAGSMLTGMYDEYNSWEWNRLTRTEAAFADTAVRVEDFEANGADGSLFDTFGSPPYHPNCGCEPAIAIGSDGLSYIVADPSPDACDYCFGIVADIDAGVP